MSTQPEALRLADLLESCPLTVGDAQQAVAAAELRRLHELHELYRDKVQRVTDALAESRKANQELLEALTVAVESDLGTLWVWPETAKEQWMKDARAAIAKHGSGA
jgi:hypothetical protein